MPSLVVLVVVVLISTMTSATHFRGGIFMARPPAGGSISDNQIEISYHISWRRNFDGGGHYCDNTTVSNGGLIKGEGYLQCRRDCTTTHTIALLSYVCTDFSIEENWSFGEGSVTFNYSSHVTGDEITVGFADRCCWIEPFLAKWSLLTRLTLTRRNDTGRINSTPRAITAPVIRLQEGCNHTIPLAVSDPDGDTVRCRWGIWSECGGLCNTFPGANLHQNSCIITYWANQGSGYKGAAIVLEDFTPGSSQPLSSVSLQFLILVVRSSSLCSQKPTFIPPTLPQGTCIAIPPSATFSTQLRANSSSLSVPITEIQTASPLGTIKGQLQHTAGTSTYFVNITWTPQPNQYNQTHLFCYTALSSGGLSSEQTCISLSTHLPPTLIAGTNIPNQQLVHPSNTTWYARFDRAIQRPTMAAFITFYNNQTNLKVYQIDTSVSLEVSFTQSNKLIIRPAYSFAEKQSFYIQLSKSIVRGVEGCRPGNEPIDDSSYWVFQTMDLTPPSILFTDNPSVSNANISLAWKSNEDVIWQCKLIAGGVATVVNCSGGVWKGINMTEATYSLRIKATDEAGNEATVMHLFIIDLTPPITVIHAKPSPISNQPNPLLTFTCNEAAACTFECKFSRISQPSSNTSQMQLVFPCNTGSIRLVLEHNSTYLFEVFGTDQAGNEGMIANYTWETDFENPHIFGISNVTIPCTNSTSPQYTGRPEAVDNQSSMVSLTYTDRNFGCFIIRTWIASDEAGNTARLFQYIHLDYLPTITSAPMIPLGCDSTANSAVVPITVVKVPNPCNLPAILNHVDSITNYTCPTEFMRNWTVSICGKMATSSQIISLYDLCPAHACGRNETPPHGVCMFGQCQCIEPWYGEDCSVPMYKPLVQKVSDTVLKEAEEYIANVTILQGTKPLSWRILSGPDGLQFNTILGQIFWSGAHAGNYTISLEVENRVGRTRIEWSVEVKPGYTAFIDHVSGRLFPKAQPVVLTGHVEYMTGNLVREFLAGVVLVEIDITSNGAVRTLKAFTTADGSFSVTFYPALTEYGRYIAASRHPRTSPVECQVEWSFLGMKAVPATITLRGEAISDFEHTFHNATTIYNNGPGPLHGLRASVAVTNNNDVHVNVSLHSLPLNGSLAPGNTALLDIAVTASQPLQHAVLIEIRSSQGTILSIVVRLYIAQILPSISVEPPTVRARVARGTSKVFEFKVTNLGKTVAGNVRALLPPTNLISFISFGKQQQQRNETSKVLDLKSGESAMLTIQMQTPPTQQLGEISTAMVISSTEVSKSVPISLIVSSSLLLNLTVVVEDEYTFFADGNPLVDNAIVTIVNYQRNIRMTNTGNGRVTFYNISEDRYELFVEAPRHRSIRLVTITSIESPMVTVFLERQAVTYRWSVTPVSYEDTYSIVLHTDFETHVPIPVVTVTPSEVDLEELEQGRVDSIQLNITNHGLIRADNVMVALPTTHPFLEFSLPNNNLGNLEALSSTIVAIKVNKRPVQKRAIRIILMSIMYTIQIVHSFVCRETQNRTTPVRLRKDFLHTPSEPFILTGPPGSTITHSFERFRRRGHRGPISIPNSSVIIIPNSPVILPIIVGGQDGGGEGRDDDLPGLDYTPYTQPYTANVSVFCNKCLQALASCMPIPDVPLIGCIPLIISKTNPLSSIENVLKWIGCVTGIKWISRYNCYIGLVTSCFGIATTNANAGRQKRTPSSRIDELVDGILPISQSIKLGVEILGDEVWLSVGDSGFLSHIYQVMDDGSELGVLISSAEFSSILALKPPNGTDTAKVSKMVERLNNTIHGWTTGQLEPEGGSNMASFSSAQKYENDIMSFNEKATSKGFSSYLDAYATARNDINRLSRWEEEEGVCAVVRIQIEQELAVTREAFLAKLEIENMENLPLSQMQLEIIIIDPNDGKIATNLFSIGNETLSGSLTKVGSKWLLPSGASGQAEWLIAPYSEAAPQSDHVYSIRGTLHYMLGNENITIPLLPTLIIVTPAPSLIVHYFWEKFVIGDDPFTDRKELSVPFTLSVVIKNVGAGVATDLRITSGQPEIIENEKGLAVSFMIIGANIGNDSITPSLTVNFGDLASNTTTVARWLMISSLQGEFKNYSAVFENKNPLGDPKLSILDELQIHELFRNVKIYNDSEDDGILDFLVSKRTNLPSELYSSKTLTRYDVEQGEVLSVSTTSAGSNSLEVTTIANNTGWVYYRYTDTQNILTNTAQTVNAMKQEENETYQIPFINTWITRDSDSRRGSETFYLHVLDFIQSTDEVIFTVTLCRTNCSSIGMPFIPPDRLIPTRPPVNTGDAANISGYALLIIILAAVTLAI